MVNSIKTDLHIFNLNMDCPGGILQVDNLVLIEFVQAEYQSVNKRRKFYAHFDIRRQLQH